MARPLSFAVIVLGIVYSKAVPPPMAHRSAVADPNGDNAMQHPHRPHVFVPEVDAGHNGTAPRRRGGEIPLTDEEKKRHPKFKPPSRGKSRTVIMIPDCFDARDQWPNCQSIRDIRDQGACSTCWAVSSASVLSDRLCIASGQVNQTYVSALHLIACYNPQKSAQQNCDQGNSVVSAYKNAATLGYISGGNIQMVGCEPYPAIPTPTPLYCPAACTNPNYRPTNPSADIRRDDSYWVHSLKNPHDESDIAQIVMEMQIEIMTNGPVTATIELWSDWQNWKASQGAYRGPSAGAKQDGYHAVRVIGWCTDQKGIPYWIIANSWGTGVGEQGIYWIERGNNVVGVDGSFSAPVISVPNTCPSSFCKTGLDQIVRVDSSNMSSLVYAFSGDCTVQVTTNSAGKLTPVGRPVPTSKVFLQAVPGPIVGWYQDSSKGIWLQNPTDGAYCAITAGIPKYSCDFYPKDGGTTTQTVLNGVTYLYDMINNPTWWFSGELGSYIGTAITSQYSKVSSLLGLSNGNILVCGSNTNGSPVCGTFDTTGKTVTAPVSVESSFTQC